jgi:hypothetical protein
MRSLGADEHIYNVGRRYLDARFMPQRQEGLAGLTRLAPNWANMDHCNAIAHPVGLRPSLQLPSDR